VNVQTFLNLNWRKDKPALIVQPGRKKFKNGLRSSNGFSSILQHADAIRAQFGWRSFSKQGGAKHLVPHFFLSSME
jgi:hypothetical protein